LKSYAVVGGAGFIGSHFVSHLLEKGHRVRVVDNFCSGTLGHIEKHLSNPDFSLDQYDVTNTEKLSMSFRGVNTVIHLASNPDIAKAASEPRVDFLQGTVLSESVAEASRIAGVQQILYASGSGVYGDAGNELLVEDSQIRPISTYGASKFAGETLFSAYAFMFGVRAIAFRFANVVGPLQTHGVAYDFLKKLRANPNELTILGDGNQSKSYIDVSDVVSAVLLAEEKNSENFNAYNISTDQQISVNEIAQFCITALGNDQKGVTLSYTGGDRGWKADVPIVKLGSGKIRDLGWEPTYTSSQAILNSIKSMIEHVRDSAD
jgi:UDP-glucose 4-epimerase